METFKDIVGFENKYQIGDFGSIKSLGRLIGSGKGYWQQEIILKPYLDKDGYVNVVLSTTNRKKKRFRIGFLVAKHFISLSIPPGFHVCHKDNDRKNNHVDNLYIGNLETNTIDKYLHGSTKITIEQTKQIRNMAGQMPQHKIAEIFGVKQPAISRIINRKRGVFIS